MAEQQAAPETDEPHGEPEREPDYRALYEAEKANSRKWETRSKANAAKAREYDQIKQSRESDSERLAAVQRELEEATAERDRLAAERSREQWAAEVSKATGVPASILRGSTREEMEAHAAAIKPFIDRRTAPVVAGDGEQPEPPESTGDFFREQFKKLKR